MTRFQNLDGYAEPCYLFSSFAPGVLVGLYTLLFRMDHRMHTCNGHMSTVDWKARIIIGFVGADALS